MFRYFRVVLATTVALVASIAFAGTAVASEATISPAGTIEMPSSGKITFDGGGIDVECPLTLRGSLLSGPIDTASTSQIGEVEGVAIATGECVGGLLTLALNLPWDVNLTSTLGTAPSAVTGVLFTVNNVQLFFFVFGEANCLYAGDLGFLVGLTRISRVAPWLYRTGTIVVLGDALSLVSGDFLCPDEITASGTLTITSQTVTIS